MVQGKDPTSFYCILHSFVNIQFSNTIFWKDCPFPIEWSLNPCWRSFDCICKGLFLGSVFYSTGLHVCPYASNTLFWLFIALYYVLKPRSMRLWILFFFFSRLFWLFKVPWDSIQILEWVFLFLQRNKQKMPLGYWFGIILNL